MEIFKYTHCKSDGREFIQYSTKPFTLDHRVTFEGLLRPETWESPSLRFNAMRGEWVAISTSRNNRPFLPPSNYCPLCPTTQKDFPTEVPNSTLSFEWAVFENMFPALAHQESGTGRCEVVLFSNDHEATLAELSLSQIEGLCLVWQDRSRTLGKIMQQVYIFENKGTEIGVTLHHPHGQIYAFNEVPPFLKLEQNQAKTFFEETGTCLVCSEIKKEIQQAHRIVFENESCVAFVPYAARYPYEVHITTKCHRPLFENLTENEVKELAETMKTVLKAYDALFDFSMPYILAHHQAAHSEPNDPSYHWHIELYPPYRSRDRLKYLAGVESGTGFFVNDTCPEQKAAELRSAVLKTQRF
jgi:UDPglucose--hexose-1-phosphate uridylyltransferase